MPPLCTELPGHFVSTKCSVVQFVQGVRQVSNKSFLDVTLHNHRQTISFSRLKFLFAHRQQNEANLLPEAKPTGLAAIMSVCPSVCVNKPREAFGSQLMDHT